MAYVEIHLEVNDLAFATSLYAGDDAIIDDADIYRLGEWLTDTVRNVLTQDGDYEPEDDQ